MKNNQLMIFSGLAIAALAALAGLTKDRWYPQGPELASVETPAAVSAPPKTDAGAGTTEVAKIEPPKAEEPPPQVAAPPKAEEPAPQVVEPPKAEEPAPQVAEPPKVEEPAPQIAEPPKVEQPAPQVAELPKAEEPAPQVAEPPKAEEPAPQPPSFDTVRVEKTGEAVIAGSAEAGAEVTVKLDGEVVGSTTANPEGSFVVVPDKPLPAGPGALTLESRGEGETAPVTSEQMVAVVVPEEAQGGAFVALVKPEQPTQVLQQPEPEPEPEAAPAEPPQPAAAETQPAPQQPAEDTPKEPVSLDVVDYDDQGNIVFSGRGHPGASVRLYVDDQPVGEAVAGSDRRWTFAGTAAIDPGQHRLRVDELAETGAVSSRVELPFFREDSAKVALAAPQPPEPPAKPQIAAVPEPELAAPQPAVPQAAAVPESEPAVPQSTAVPEPEPAAQAPEPPAESASEPAAPSTTATDESQVAAAQPEILPRNGRIVIQPGNNLWRLSRVIYGRGIKYTVIYEANKDQIRDPDMIYPGQVFKTPDVVPPESISPKRRKPLAPEEGGGAAPG